MKRAAIPEHNALKSCWKLLVRDAGKVDVVASVSRALPSLISEYGSLHSDRFPPVDVVLDVERFTGHPHVTAEMAKAQGYALVPVEVKGHGELAVHLAQNGASFAELMARGAEVLADGKVEAAEADDMGRRFQQLAILAQHAAMAMQDAARRQRASEAG